MNGWIMNAEFTKFMESLAYTSVHIVLFCVHAKNSFTFRAKSSYRSFGFLRVLGTRFISNARRRKKIASERRTPCEVVPNFFASASSSVAVTGKTSGTKIGAGMKISKHFPGSGIDFTEGMTQRTNFCSGVTSIAKSVRMEAKESFRNPVPLHMVKIFISRSVREGRRSRFGGTAFSGVNCKR
eukprot:g1149.t1